MNSQVPLNFIFAYEQKCDEKNLDPAKTAMSVGLSDNNLSRTKRYYLNKPDYNISWNVAIRLVLVLELTLDESNALLYHAGYILSEHISKDREIIDSIVNHAHLQSRFLPE